MDSRKMMFYGAAAAIGLAGVVISQIVMSTVKPSVALAAGYPAMLLLTGFLAGLCAYLADPTPREVPKPSNDHEEPRRQKVRTKIRLSPRT